MRCTARERFNSLHMLPSYVHDDSTDHLGEHAVQGYKVQIISTSWVCPGPGPHLLWWAASAVAASALPFCSSRRSKHGSTGWLSGIAWKQGYAPWPGAPPGATALDPGALTKRCVTPAQTQMYPMTVQCPVSERGCA